MYSTVLTMVLTQVEAVDRSQLLQKVSSTTVLSAVTNTFTLPLIASGQFTTNASTQVCTASKALDEYKKWSTCYIDDSLQRPAQ